MKFVMTIVVMGLLLACANGKSEIKTEAKPEVVSAAQETEDANAKLFASPPVILTCKSSQADFELEARRRLAVYESRVSFCRYQKASTEVIDRCLKQSYDEWRRLEGEIEQLMVDCSARAPDAPETCETQISEYEQKVKGWRDERTVELAQCDVLETKAARQQCEDECVERFNLKRPREPVCASKDGRACQAAEAEHKKALALWEEASQKELDECKEEADCVDRVVVRWRPSKPRAPECSKEAVCDRDVREYRRQLRSLRLQRVASERACRGQASRAAKAACERAVRKHFRNRVALLKKPTCANADAPDVRVRSKCPKGPAKWDCKAQKCSGPDGAAISSRCCSHKVRAACARKLLAKGVKRCDKLKTRKARAACRAESRKEADEITKKRKCPSVASFERRLAALRKDRDRDVKKCAAKDDKCREAATKLFTELQKEVTEDPCFRQSDRCDVDVREYRRAIRAVNLERKIALKKCTTKACREDTRARFTVKRRQLTAPVCDGAEVVVTQSCARQKRRYKRQHAELERQRETGQASCHALPNFQQRRACEKLLLVDMEKRRKLIKKPLCKENARSFPCRARVSEYARTLKRFHGDRRAALKACKKDRKCASAVIVKFATKRKALRRPSCARHSERNKTCQKSKAAYRKAVRAHNAARRAAHKACKVKDTKCREAVTKRFRSARKRIPLPKCQVRVHKEIKRLRECATLSSRKERRLCRNRAISKLADEPSKSGRRLRALTKCHRFTERVARSACEAAARARYPKTRRNTLTPALKKCAKAPNFHECRAAVLSKELSSCADATCRRRARRQARRFLTRRYRKKSKKCKTAECRRAADRDFFRRLHQEELDVRTLRCNNIKDEDRRSDCLEGVRHRHRITLGVRLCREEHKRGEKRTACVRAARLAGCHEFGDADVKQRCISRQDANDRLDEARAACRTKHSRKSPELRKCLEEARKDLPVIERSCAGRFGRELLRCERRNAREARNEGTRLLRRALRRCKGKRACRSRKQTDLLETRSVYRRYMRALLACGKPTALRNGGTVVKCVATVKATYLRRRDVTRAIRRCDRISIDAGRRQCRDKAIVKLQETHCPNKKDTKCPERLGAFFDAAVEERATRVSNHKQRVKCRAKSSKAERDLCLVVARKQARSRNRIERGKAVCLNLKDPKAERQCVRRAVGGSDAVPVRVVASQARAASTSGGFPLWAIAPIVGGALLVVVLVVIGVAYSRVKARRNSGDRVALASSVDAV